MPTWRLLQYIAILAQFTNSLPKNCGSWKQFHSGFLRFRFCAHCPAICPWHVWLWRPGTRGGALCGWGCRSLWASASTLCASGVGLELLDHAVLWETHLQLLRSPAGPKSSIAVEQWIGKKKQKLSPVAEWIRTFDTSPFSILWGARWHNPWDPNTLKHLCNNSF